MRLQKDGSNTSRPPDLPNFRFTDLDVDIASGSDPRGGGRNGGYLRLRRRPPIALVSLSSVSVF